jgi:hypothetical protein
MIRTVTATTGHADVLREVLRSGADTKRAVDARLRAFDRIPFVTDAVRNSHLQLLPDDPVPEKIDPVLIRKSSPDNCLLSVPLRVGEVVYFNLLKETTEINIDHRSDHFVGLFILEGVRQIGMALSHLLADIPLDTRMSLQEFSLYFYNYIEMDYPIVARGVATLSLDPDLRRDQTAFIDVRQNGRTCLAGTSSGRLFDTEERYQRIRSKTRVMNERYADDFASSLRSKAPQSQGESP